MLRITEVVKMLLIINIVVYIGSTMILGEGTAVEVLGLHSPGTKGFAPYQLVTNMFMHFDTNHLIMNMIGLFFFGPSLEQHWGPKRFLYYYLYTGIGATILAMLVNFMVGTVSLSAGASGSIFGILAGFALIFPNKKIMLLLFPVPIAAKYLIMGFAALELYQGISNINSTAEVQVGHFAHLGGALFGLILIMYWRKFGSRL